MTLLEKAEQITNHVQVMQLVRTDYNDDNEPDGVETICYINARTPLFCSEHWIGANYYGCNLYAVVDGKIVLLETYDDEDDITGKELASNVIQSIKDGFTAGATYYNVPSN